MTELPNMPERPFPAFEGKIVAGVVNSIRGTAPMEEVDNTVLSVDDRVLMLAEYTVVGVRHEVDEKTGELVRHQVLRPITMRLHPWDPDDPDDDGVLRSRHLPPGVSQ